MTFVKVVLVNIQLMLTNWADLPVQSRNYIDSEYRYVLYVG